MHLFYTHKINYIEIIYIFVQSITIYQCSLIPQKTTITLLTKKPQL